MPVRSPSLDAHVDLPAPPDPTMAIRLTPSSVADVAQVPIGDRQKVATNCAFPSAEMACSINSAMVVGPTPRGTGVIMPGTERGSEKAMSATLPSCSRRR